MQKKNVLSRVIRPKNYRPDFLRYEQLKRSWVYEHPQATPDEYSAAMRDLAVRCGI